MIKDGLVMEVFKNVCFVRSIKKRAEGREAEISLFTTKVIRVKIGQPLEPVGISCPYPFTTNIVKVILGYHLLSQRFTPPHPFTLKVD